LSADRYSILFEPVKLGPKTAKNRFYQVPYCNGAGFRWPRTMAYLRGMKAEGGWGVVCTEEWRKGWHLETIEAAGSTDKVLVVGAGSGIKSVQVIGDGHAPGTIAAAVYAGHLYARQLDNPVDLRYEFPRENLQPRNND